ncbi:hypothetical protein Baya_10036 [Bagarius yarrelli]|uniref:Uncharacterized protein n=1 Tax=Bagarius yarrelli TaxID=175774 RepID=A0A556UEM9_BAGYA|nr:hypothetical protein Baya_10036 [Bagarius yarrelli]
MASAVTALNHYTKTMIRIKFKRKNIVNNLELLGLHGPVGLWDTYPNPGLKTVEQHIAFAMNGTSLLYSSSQDTAALQLQCEGYC